MSKSITGIGTITGKQFIINRLWVPLMMFTGISILSGSAGVQTGGWSFAGIDKIGHLVVFGLLGIAIARLFRDATAHRLRVCLLSVAIATGFGGLDEFHQFHNPLRTFEWADLMADFAGSLLATGLYLWWGGFRRIM